MAAAKHSSHKEAPAEPAPKRVRISRRTAITAAALLLVAGVSAGVAWDWYSAIPEHVHATYVGRQKCIECHASEGHQWTRSDHDLAMAVATPATVLGDFSGVDFTALGVTSRMYREGERYMVRTEGPDGKLHEYQVKYTFGVRPLQQYLVEFDRPADMPENEIARCQVLPLSWDIANKKWFHLTPTDVKDKIEPGDDLHWTGVAYRWNNMCADCHSTNLQKNYNASTRTYHTTFSEMNVSCEACHGPGSVHVELARAKSLFWDRRRGYGLANLKSSDTRVEIESCATCHARRHIVYPGFEGGDKFHDHFAHSLIEENLYYPDGQILDEVYEYGSFIQSKMYANKIRCTDCHDPHTTKLKHEGNKVCTSCHQHPDYKFDVPAHHHHLAGSTGAQCVDCHMPGRYYMEVDFRRDHSMRVPRPDLSVALGTPNACTGCHLARELEAESPGKALPRYEDCLAAAKNGDAAMKEKIAKLDRWATDKVEEWYGKHHTPDDHFAPALAAAWRGDPHGEEPLLRWLTNKDLSPMARASLLVQASQYGGEHIDQLTKLLADKDPLVRSRTVSSVDMLTERDRRRLLVPLLTDPVRGVRTEAARQLASVPREDFTGTEREQLTKVLFKEYVEGLLANNDRAGAHAVLGLMYYQFGDLVEAEKAFRTGMEVEPAAVGPRTNLAVLYDARADRLEQELSRLAQNAEQQSIIESVQLTRNLRGEAVKWREEELKLIARDAKLAPKIWSVQYDYGRALNALNRLGEAETTLLKAAELNPNAVPPAIELVLVYRKLRKWDAARKWAEKLVALRPESQMFRDIVGEVETLRKIEGQSSP